jgi:DNA modification methylase
MIDVIHGDCLAIMRGMESGSVDAIVTDPPGGIRFRGKQWDSDRGGRNQWIMWLCERMAEARRVIKPGRYALVWSLPRLSHWTACAIEESGWIIKDRISCIFGQGHPKSKISLKPAVEDWWLCMAPGDESESGPEIEACRVKVSCDNDKSNLEDKPGRWPPNLCIVHHPDCHQGPTEFICVDGCPVRLIDVMGGKSSTSYRENPTRQKTRTNQHSKGNEHERSRGKRGYPDSGNVSRYFPVFSLEETDFVPIIYYPKTSRKDRGAGNTHPTVKPQKLMCWLVRLICPPGGLVLDLFAGSGTTGLACLREGFRCILIENEAGYIPIINRRIYEFNA